MTEFSLFLLRRKLAIFTHFVVCFGESATVYFENYDFARARLRREGVSRSVVSCVETRWDTAGTLVKRQL